MMPRKRSRLNPSDTSTIPTSQSSSSNTSLPASSSEQSLPRDQPMTPSASKTEVQITPEVSQQGTVRKIRKTPSWYGSWPRTPNKASASTSISRESILGGSVRSEKTADLSRFESRRDSDTNSIHSTVRPVPDLPKISEDGANGSGGDDGKDAGTVTAKDADAVVTDVQKTDEQPEPAPSEPPQPDTPAGWLGWLARTPFTETQAISSPHPTKDVTSSDAEVLRPSTPPAQTATTATDPEEAPKGIPPSSSWFSFLSYGTQATPPKTQDIDESNKKTEEVDMQDPPPPVVSPQNPETPPKAGSTWAFWSKDSPTAKGAPAVNESGHIAVMGEGSESHPKPMTENDVSGSPSGNAKEAVKVKDASTMLTWRKTKRLRPPSMDIDGPSPSPSGTSTPVTQEQTKVDSSNKSIAESEISIKTAPNLVLPSFASTYRMKENPSILKQVASFLLRAQQPPAAHAFRNKDVPKIRKAIAIGIHGLFPATYLRPMIGQPTGTSLRFASLCADAIRKWADEHGSPDCEIEKVALEGEGRISERVDNLWKLMLNWIEHIRSADLIILACHSQGVPVSIMLLEKLIDLGIITNTKIGVCAMAGVSLGPFQDYKSGLFMGSAAELWDFANPESANSLRFETSLKRVLGYGARITFVGSIDDQVVPLESAVYSPANHPNIYRAVFIDSRVHAPDFIAHLVGFALKLRNLGVSDHGLIRELSIPLAGSLYSGEGHSRLYFDAQVYDLAISHALETTAPPRGTACTVTHHTSDGPANPYVLPWIMRGMLEETFVKTELNGETEILLKQFDDWKPNNKALKDVKYRLEAVRSRL